EPSGEPELGADLPPCRRGPREAAVEHRRGLRRSGSGPRGAAHSHRHRSGSLGGRRDGHARAEPARHARARRHLVRGLRHTSPTDWVEPLPRRRPGGSALLGTGSGEVVGEHPDNQRDLGRVPGPGGVRVRSPASAPRSATRRGSL
ncbi:MAG: hypothetical protein AVDCRST_MAG80-869, partial [uncultured Rubrobacteraceae bacterium]